MFNLGPYVPNVASYVGVSMELFTQIHYIKYGDGIWSKYLENILDTFDLELLTT